METLLTIIKIITKFVYCVTAGIQLLSMVLMVQPDTYNQRQVIDTVTVYKPDYGNIHPLYTISYKVILAYPKCLSCLFSEVPFKYK
jgi:hypothetical protein